MLLSDFQRRLTRWSRVLDPRGGIITLTLDLSRSGPLPPETRQFFKHRVLKTLQDGNRPLRTLAARIEEYVTDHVRPESEGLFLVAAPDLWETIELPVPLHNFLWIGSAPYLAPLLELEERAPRSIVLVADRSRVRIMESYLGFLEPLAEVALQGEERKPQRSVNLKTSPLRASGGRITRRSDASNEKRTRHADERVAVVFREAGRKLLQISKEIKPATILLFGDRASVPGLFQHVPKVLSTGLEYLGPSPETERDLKSSVAKALERRIKKRRIQEVRRVLELRSQGHLVSLGTSSVLGRLGEGTGLRFYLAPYEPVPGVVCENCGARFADQRSSCGFCRGKVYPVSLTQEVVAAKLARPETGVTFVTSPAKWLDDLGGLVAIRKPLKVG